PDRRRGVPRRAHRRAPRREAGHRRQRGAEGRAQRSVPVRQRQEVQEVSRSGRVSDQGLATLAWVLSGLSLAGGVIVLLPWFQRALDHRAFAEQIRKLLLAGNAPRARKLCGAAPRSPVAVALGLTLESYERSQGLGGAELVQRLREVYLGSFTALMRGA